MTLRRGFDILRCTPPSLGVLAMIDIAFYVINIIILKFQNWRESYTKTDCEGQTRANYRIQSHFMLTSSSLRLATCAGVGHKTSTLFFVFNIIILNSEERVTCPKLKTVRPPIQRCKVILFRVMQQNVRFCPIWCLMRRDMCTSRWLNSQAT